MTTKTFSEAEHTALLMCHKGLLVSHVDAVSTIDPLGSVVPGMRVFKALEKQGFLYTTEEDPIDVDGVEFEFTPSIELTNKGLRAWECLRSGSYVFEEEDQLTPGPG